MPPRQKNPAPKAQKPKAEPKVKPKKEKPEDPLLARVHEGERPRLLPIPQKVIRNVSPAAERAAAAVLRLERLEGDIRVLNQAKAAVYRELNRDGFDTLSIKNTLKDRRIDPVLRAERYERTLTYWEQINAALEAGDNARIAVVTEGDAAE